MPFQKPFVSRFALMVFLMLPQSAAFSKSHPYSQDFEARVAELFLTNGRPSLPKIDAYIARLKEKQTEVVGLLVNAEVDKKKSKGKNPKLKKIAKKAEEEDLSIGFLSAIERLEKMKNAASQAEVMSLGYDALDLEATMRIKGKELITTVLPKAVLDLATSWRVPLVSPVRDEASNLSKTPGVSLSVRDLEQAQKSGVDVSRLDPVASSEFWQKQTDISSIDVKQASLGRTLDFYKGSEVEFPVDATYIFDNVKHTDTKPKIDSYVTDDKGKKRKFKLKFGAEVHSEPTAAALSMTLGFPADITKFERRIKLVLGKKTLSDLKRDWETYYLRDASRLRYKIENYIESSGTDKKIGHWVVMKDALVEARPKNTDRLGGWRTADNGVGSLREVRALIYFQIFLDNTDYQEFSNNTVLVKADKNLITKKAHIVSDLGHTFGGLMQEKPELYSSKMIHSRDSSSIVLNFKSFQPSDIKNKMTLADLKWTARLIGQLTDAQIRDAFAVGGWPRCVQDVYVERMIERRNDLLQGLGLVGEVQANGTTLELLPSKGGKSIELTSSCDQKATTQGFSTDFSFDIESLLQPIGRATVDAVLDLARLGVSSIRRIRIEPGRIETTKGFGIGKISPSPVIELIAAAPRTVERNPDPKSEKDIYIVKDEFEFGVRLGAAFGIYKDFVITKKYSISYPVRTLDEARLANGFVVNAMLPRDLRKGDVPKNYVLKTETFLSSGAGVELTNLHTPIASPSIRIGHDKVFLGRAVLDARDEEKVLLYRDEAEYTASVVEAFARISIINIPIFSTISEKGTVEGRAVVLKRKDIDADKKVGDQLAAAVANGDFAPFKAAEQKLTLRNDFKAKKQNWFLILWKGRSDTQIDHLNISEEDATKATLQIRSSRERTFAFLDNKETRSVRVEVSGENGKPESRQVSIKALGFDSNTKDKELSKGYLNYINGVSLNGEKLIVFTPELGWSVNGKWGSTLTESELTIYSAGLERISRMTEAQYWAAFGKRLGLSANAIKTAVARYKKGELAPEMYNLIDHSRSILNKLKKVSKAKTEEKTYERVASLFREAVFQTGPFYEGRLLAVLGLVAGEKNVYSRHIITGTGFADNALVGEVPMTGEQGVRKDSKNPYIMLKPQNAVDLYTMFDSWF